MAVTGTEVFVRNDVSIAFTPAFALWQCKRKEVFLHPFHKTTLMPRQLHRCMIAYQCRFDA